MKKILSLVLALALAPAGANRVQNIFAGGVYVGKNTFRLANVRVVRLRRTASALRRAAAFSNESPTKWVSFESLSKILFLTSSSAGSDILPALFC